MKRIFGSYYFVFFMCMAVTQPFLSLYLSYRGISSEMIGFIIAGGNFAGVMVQPILGHVNDQLSDSRRLLLFSAIVSPIVFAGYAATKTPVVLFLVAVLVAIVQSTSPIADSMIVQAATGTEFTYGQIRLWGALSWALTTMMAGYVYHRTSLVWLFPAYGAFSILLAAITVRLPKPKRASGQQKPGMSEALSAVKDVRLLSFIVISFFFSGALTINSTYLPLYFKALHHPLGLVGLNFTVAALTEVPLFYLSGKLMNQLGKFPTLVIASLLYGLKCLLMALGPGTAIVIAIQALDGIGYALYWSAAVQVVTDLAPTGRPATAQALFGALASSLSSIVGASIGGWIFAHLGPLQTYGVDGAFAIVACIGYAVFGHVERRRLNVRKGQGLSR